MSNTGVIDINQLWEQQKWLEPGEITLVGGSVAESALSTWLSRWTFDNMSWRLWEYVSSIHLEENSAEEKLPDTEPLIQDVTILERGRLFGTAGDLTLRRDGADFRWWFVGEKTYGLPAQHGGQDFWSVPAHQQKRFCQISQEVILWGAYQDGVEPRWYDDRVGYADLRYPASLRGHRHVYAQYREYLDGGQVAAVWMYDLVGKSEES